MKDIGEATQKIAAKDAGPTAELAWAVNELNTLLIAHMQSETERNRRFTDAFANGDIDAHRIGHELQIQAAKDKAEFWHDLRKSVAKWGALAVLGWIGTSIWHEVVASFLKLIGKS